MHVLIAVIRTAFRVYFKEGTMQKKSIGITLWPTCKQFLWFFICCVGHLHTLLTHIIDFALTSKIIFAKLSICVKAKTAV